MILTGSSETGFQVSRWLSSAFAATAGVIVLGWRDDPEVRRMPHAIAADRRFVGAKGTTRTDAHRRRGAVLVNGERWDAITEDGEPIEDDTPIIVTRSEGFMLYVKRDPAFVKLLPAAHVAGEPDGPAGAASVHPRHA